MPVFEIQLSIWNSKGGPFEDTVFKKRSVLGFQNCGIENFTKEDIKELSREIKNMINDYNNGVRGGPMVFKKKE